MSSFVKRFLEGKAISKRLISQLTNKREGKLAGLLARYMQLLSLDASGKRGISQTHVLQKDMFDDMELATGIAKRELKLREAGITDPWSMAAPLKRGAGTIKEPTPIPSAFEGRLVGCLCLNDRFVKWMWLEKGEPKRCECGHYFKLKHMPPI